MIVRYGRRKAATNALGADYAIQKGYSTQDEWLGVETAKPGGCHVHRAVNALSLSGCSAAARWRAGFTSIELQSKAIRMRGGAMAPPIARALPGPWAS